MEQATIYNGYFIITQLITYFTITKIIKVKTINANSNASLYSIYAFYALIVLIFHALLQSFVLPQELLRNLDKGSSFINYDYYIQESLKANKININFVSFIEGTLMIDILRHPISGILYYLSWITLEDYNYVKYFFLILFFISCIFIYKLTIKLTNNQYISFLCGFLYIINPLNNWGANQWTFRMSHNVTGVLLIVLSLYIFVTYLEKYNLLRLYGALLLFLCSFLSYEVFYGFIIVYFILYYFKTQFIDTATMTYSKSHNYHKFFALFTAILLPIIFKIILYYFVVYLDLGHHSYVYIDVRTFILDRFHSFTDYVFAYGSSFSEQTSIIDSHYNPIYKLYDLLKRTHFGYSIVEYFQFKKIPNYIKYIYIILIFSVNIFFVFILHFIEYSVQKSSTIFIYILGISILLSSVIIQYVFSAQIHIRYIYCGYFGVTLIIAAFLYYLFRNVQNDNWFLKIFYYYSIFFVITSYESMFMGSIR